MDLRIRCNGRVDQTEGRNSPVQIVFIPVAATERQLFTQGSFIDLDNLNAGSFQVQNFILDGQGNLQGRVLDGNIFPWEGPVEDSYRSRQHSLNRLVSPALSIAGPFNSNRVEAGYIAPDNRRFHPTHTVGLHPTVLGEEVAGQVLTEVFYHVITLKFPVNQNIKTNFFLPLDPFVNLLSQKLVIVFLGQFSLAEGQALGPNFLGLREGTDGCRRKGRQFEGFFLNGFAFCEGRQTSIVCICQSSDTSCQFSIFTDTLCRKEFLIGSQGFCSATIADGI